MVVVVVGFGWEENRIADLEFFYALSRRFLFFVIKFLPFARAVSRKNSKNTIRVRHRRRRNRFVTINRKTKRERGFKLSTTTICFYIRFPFHGRRANVSDDNVDNPYGRLADELTLARSTRTARYYGHAAIRRTHARRRCFHVSRLEAAPKTSTAR